MAAQKFLTLDLTSGQEKLMAGVLTATADAIPALDATGRLSASQMPVGITAETVVATASEALSSGDFVNLYDNAGTINVRKANATTAGKPAHGFVLASVSASANATVYMESNANTALTGLTDGARYFLSTTGGGVVSSVSTFVAGNLVQELGVAVSATTINFSKYTTIEIA